MPQLIAGSIAAVCLILILILIDRMSLSTPTHSLDVYYFLLQFPLVPCVLHVGACWCQPVLCLVGTRRKAISGCVDRVAFNPPVAAAQLKPPLFTRPSVERGSRGTGGSNRNRQEQHRNSISLLPTSAPTSGSRHEWRAEAP